MKERAMRLAGALLLAAGLAGLWTGAAMAKDPVKINALDFESEGQTDRLKLYATAPIEPEVIYGERPTRIILKFNNSEPLEGLKETVAQRRGACVERFEVIAFHAGEPNGEETSIHLPPAAGSMKNAAFIVAYTEGGVSVDKADNGIGYFNVTFNCAEALADITYPPSPLNRLEHVYIERFDERDVINLVFTRAMEPVVKRFEDPHRISISLPDSLVSAEMAAQIRKAALETMVRADTIGVGSEPTPYVSIDDDRQFRFVSESSPYEIDAYSSRQWGEQSRNFVIIFHEDDRASIEVVDSERDRVVSISIARSYPARRNGADTMCIEVPTMGFPVQTFSGYGLEN